MRLAAASSVPCPHVSATWPRAYTYALSVTTLSWSSSSSSFAVNRFGIQIKLMTVCTRVCVSIHLSASRFVPTAGTRGTGTEQKTNKQQTHAHSSNITQTSIRTRAERSERGQSNIRVAARPNHDNDFICLMVATHSSADRIRS